jgi:hypothetical protein
MECRQFPLVADHKREQMRAGNLRMSGNPLLRECGRISDGTPGLRRTSHGAPLPRVSGQVVQPPVREESRMGVFAAMSRIEWSDQIV